MNVKNLPWKVRKLYDIRGDIDPSPQYQRGPVWSLQDKQLLIDSILRGFDIPKIYLRKVDTQAYDYETADGQQRLRAIWDYIDDEYPLSADCSVPGAAGTVYSDLPTALQKKIDNFQLVTAVAYHASSSEIRELFIRLQKGMPLSEPEKRNAIPSQLGDTVRMIASTHAFCTTGPFSSARYKTDDLVAHAFLVELSEGKRDLKAPELRRMYSDYAAGIDDSISGRVVAVLDVLNSMQTWKPKCISRKWGFVDVYWIVSEMLTQDLHADAKSLAEKFVAFESRRLRYVSHAEDLLEGTPSKTDRELFEYIEAFRTTGGLATNVQTRHRVLSNVLIPKKRATAHGK